MMGEVVGTERLLWGEVEWLWDFTICGDCGGFS